MVEALGLIFIGFFGNVASFAEPPAVSEDISSVGRTWPKTYGEQFATDGLWLAWAGTGILTAVSFHNDQRWTDKIAQHQPIPAENWIEPLGIIGNSPLVPIGIYGWGRWKSDRNTQIYALKSAVAMLTVLSQTVALSQIPIHSRPDDKNLGFFDRAFRGASSFPSGHVAGIAIWASTVTLEYGWKWGAPLWVLAGAQSLSRIQTRKHFVSDVVFSLGISAIGSVASFRSWRLYGAPGSVQIEGTF